MTSYLTPGVYYERVDASTPKIAAIRTDVAGFVGIAERGPVDRRVPIESWRQYQAHFGRFIGAGFLAYSVRGYFENGGRRCWVVRVASRDEATGAAPASIAVQDETGRDRFLISASSPGAWGNQLSLELREVRRAQAVTDPLQYEAECSVLSAGSGASGFERGGLTRLTQDGGASAVRVVSKVDASSARLYWVHPDATKRLPSDEALAGFDVARPIFVEGIDYTLLVRELGRIVFRADRLSVVRSHARYAPMVLKDIYEEFEKGRLDRLPATPRPVVVTDMDQDAIDPLDPISVPEFLAGGQEGLAALRPEDFIGEMTTGLEDDETRAAMERGFHELGLVEEVFSVAIPDIHIQPASPHDIATPEICVPDPCLPTTAATTAEPYRRTPPEQPPVFDDDQVFRVQAALVQHCELRQDRMAILDPPAASALDRAEAIALIRAWRQRFDSKYTALYYPWVSVREPRKTARGQLLRHVPPSGHILGRYASTDLQVGVHKAPANVGLEWAEDVSVQTSDEEHGMLNEDGVNVIRPFSGRGIRIAGARTVSADPDWRFLNVRRLVLMVREAVARSTQWVVFEPNGYYTRANVRVALSSFLDSLWKQGALAGGQAEEAYYVKCDEENNPPEVSDGRLIADVAIAPAYPFEFVVLRVGRTANELEISETVEREEVAQ